MKQLNNSVMQANSQWQRTTRPIKIMQFGEGNFLRAFIDWMIHTSNQKGLMHTGVVVVQPLEVGRIDALAQQDGLYNLMLAGVEQGVTKEETTVIDCLQEFINPYTQYQEYLNYAKSEALEIIFSNTTEAGITFDATDTNHATCPNTFPGKLLAFLHARYKHFAGDMACGLEIVPCELIDANGDALKHALVQLAETMHYDADFIAWLTQANHFANTLVDRIVSGYPRDTIAQIEQTLGYTDNSVVQGEIFHLFVVEGSDRLKEVMPFDKAGIDCLFVDSIKPYKERKVKILNGAHTAMVPVAYLCGIDTVGEAIATPLIHQFVTEAINHEIIPTINLPEREKTAYGAAVMERFKNPFVVHPLLSISLNSMTKYVTRILPSVLDYIELYGALPRRLLFSLAALMVFYRGIRHEQPIPLQDDQFFLDFWKEQWAEHGAGQMNTEALVRNFVSMQDHFGVDLTKVDGLVGCLVDAVDAILDSGMQQAVENLLKE